jgi:hypothetical protein
MPVPAATAVPSRKWRSAAIATHSMRYLCKSRRRLDVQILLWTRILRGTMSSPWMATGQGLPSVARAKRERRMVAQICPRWNRLADWLREAERYAAAA